ncbi:unnamed protein product [Parajaminaea phylloscopi]
MGLAETMPEICGIATTLLGLEDRIGCYHHDGDARSRGSRLLLRLRRSRLPCKRPSNRSDDPPAPVRPNILLRPSTNPIIARPTVSIPARVTSRSIPPCGSLLHLLSPHRPGASIVYVPSTPPHRYHRRISTAPGLDTIWGGCTPLSEDDLDARLEAEKVAAPVQDFKGLHLLDGDDESSSTPAASADNDASGNFFNIAREEDLHECPHQDEETDDGEETLIDRHEEKATSHLTETPAATAHYDPKRIFRAFIREFGALSPGQGEVAGGDEELIAVSSSVVMRTVSIHGSLILTTRRLAFVALLPTVSAHGDSKTDVKSEVSENITQDNSDVIRQGPAVLHFPGWRRSRTAWFELRADSLVCYRDSTHLYQPVGSGRLSDITLMPSSYAPSGKATGASKRVYIKTPSGLYALAFYSEETANLWHKDLQAAIWKFRNSRERVRVAFDLLRLVSMRMEPHSHYVLAHLGVATGTPHGDAAPSSLPVMDLTFGLLASHANLFNQLKQAVQKVKGHADTADIDIERINATPEPLIELEYDSRTEDSPEGPPDDAQSLGARLTKLFTLHDDPASLKIAKAEVMRGMPLSGTLAIGSEYLVFIRHRLPPFHDIRIKIPLKDIVGVRKSKSIFWHHYQIKVLIRGAPTLGFRFTNQQRRDLVLAALRSICEETDDVEDAEDDHDGRGAESHSTEDDDPIETLLEPARATKTAVLPYQTIRQLPRLINRTYGTSMTPESMRIVCLTIGSRGDVQPYIALCKGFKAQGHDPVIVSHPEYREWVEKHGIEFRGAGGDPAALMKLSVEHRLFSPAFFKESVGKFRSWLDELLRECFEQCWDAELLIESPSTMAGIHVAEALQCFYFRAFTMPWTRTKHLPQAFSVPSVDLGEAYNWSSYTMFDRVFWQATSGQINRWRRYMLHLAPIDYAELDQDSVPFVYNFSSAVVPHPIDWPDRIAVTGYWFLDSQSEKWEAPQDLLDFIKDARRAEKKLVYIGFGSITVPDANKVTQSIYDAVQKADVRAVVSKGWSSRLSSSSSDQTPEPKAPAEVYVVDAIPHDWLFPQIDVAMHHGGAGSTGASLRAGLVTLIHPFFGDQFFWAGRVQKLGAGARVSNLTCDDIAEALSKATTDRIMKEKAAIVGSRIRAEDGVVRAINFIESHLESSRRKHHPLKPKKRRTLIGTRCNSDTGGKTKDDQSVAEEEVDDADDHADEDSKDDHEFGEDRENAETIRRDFSTVQRILSASGLAHSEGGQTDSNTRASNGISTPTKGAPSTPGQQPARSSSFFSHGHLPFNVNLFGTLRAVVPGLHDSDHSHGDAGESSADSPAAASSKTRKDAKKSGRAGEGEPSTPTGEDAEEQEEQEKETKDAKTEDARRRAAMQDRLRERERLLTTKRSRSDSVARAQAHAQMESTKAEGLRVQTTEP